METSGDGNGIKSEELELNLHGNIVDMINNRRRRYKVAFQNLLNNVIYVTLREHTLRDVVRKCLEKVLDEVILVFRDTKTDLI